MTTRQFIPSLVVVSLIVAAASAAEPAKEDAVSGCGGAVAVALPDGKPTLSIEVEHNGQRRVATRTFVLTD